MTAEQFTYWMQGFSELNSEPPTAEQWQMIRDHLQTVFHKVTPDYTAFKWAAEMCDTASAPRLSPLPTTTCTC